MSLLRGLTTIVFLGILALVIADAIPQPEYLESEHVL